ncbi:Xanthine phosphoribosyltransferase, partial [Haemophilus influenzae]
VRFVKCTLMQNLSLYLQNLQVRN